MHSGSLEAASEPLGIRIRGTTYFEHQPSPFCMEDEHGGFGWGAFEDAKVHSCVDELTSSVATYPYGRRMLRDMGY